MDKEELINEMIAKNKGYEYYELFIIWSILVNHYGFG